MHGLIRGQLLSERTTEVRISATIPSDQVIEAVKGRISKLIRVQGGMVLLLFYREVRSAR